MNDIKITKKDNIKYLQFNSLLKYNVKHCITFKSLNFNIDYDNYIDTYKLLCNELKIDYHNLIILNQTHSDNIEIINKPNNNIIEDTDSIITNKKNIILTTHEADCTPVLLYDTKNKVIANVHSGWKGTLKEITIKTILKMINTYNISYEDLIVCIGPHIRDCHFEVDEDIKDLFLNKFGDKYISKGEIKDNKQKYLINTENIIIDSLLNLGIKKDNISTTNICTVCNRECHSYRREKTNSGRTVALITL